MKTIMHWLPWLCGVIAVLLMLFGTIHFLFDFSILGVGHGINYFHAANSFLLIAICTQLCKVCGEKKE